MKKFLSRESGVTIITVTSMIVVIAVILSVIVYYARNSIQMEAFGNLRADVEEIENKAQMYYIEKGTLPIEQDVSKTRMQMEGDDEFFNPNDGDVYYLINVDLIDVNLMYDSEYYINDVTHTVYAEKTIKINGKNYPRPKEDFDRLNVASSSIEWENECYTAPSDMFSFDNDGYITGINIEFCNLHCNDSKYTRFFTDAINWKNLIIPAYQSNGQPVVGIRTDAFTNININGGVLKIPSSIKNVENSIIGSTSNLVVMYVNAKNIDIDAFNGRGFSQVNKIVIGPECHIPDGNSAGNGVFSMAQNLSEVVIGTTSLGKYAFSNCINLKNIQFESSLKIIPEGCFMNSSNANNSINVVFPDSLTRIEKRAFANGAIEELNMTEALEYIGEEAFASVNWGQPKLKKINFNGNTRITEIQQKTFIGCNNLTSVTLGDSVKIIKKSAFERCTNNLSLVVCNDKLETIEDSAFKDCSALQNGSVQFNKGLKYIGHYAFAGTNLQNRNIPSGTQYESDSF